MGEAVGVGDARGVQRGERYVGVETTGGGGSKGDKGFEGECGGVDRGVDLEDGFL